jgi:hypothetical protein
MPSHTSDGSGKLTYEFGLEPHASILPLTNGGSWAFFSATFSAGGSGTLTRLALLQYQHGGIFLNLLPYVAVTNVSEHAVWTILSASPYPVLVIANFVWGSDETHFAPHHYVVEAWRFDNATDRYKKAVSYQTSKKYEGGDYGPISVLGPEQGRSFAVSTLDNIQRKPGERSLLVARLHVEASFIHGADDLIEGDFVLVFFGKRHTAGVHRFDRSHRVALDAGDLD